MIKNIVDINPEDVKKSKKWFDEQVSIFTSKRMTPNKILHSSGLQLTTNLIPGKMYFFAYDAKLKDTLPYWDRFPLVIPFIKHTDGFTSINFHYLGYRERTILLKELDKIAGSGVGETRKIQMSWALVARFSKLRGAKACVKRYLTAHIKSPFCVVPTESWYTAMMMPVQRFVGATKEQVWNDSRKY